MNEEKKFDELLSSKLSEREFPLDELNWDKAERLITAQERRKKILRFSLVFSGGLALGIGIMLPFIWNANTTLTDKIVAKSKNTQEPLLSNSSTLIVSQLSQSTTKILKNNCNVPTNNESIVAKNSHAIPTGSVRTNFSTTSPVSKGLLSIVAKDKADNTKFSNRAAPGITSFAGKPTKSYGHQETIKPDDPSSKEQTTNIYSSQTEKNKIAQSKKPSNTSNAPDKNDSSNNSALIRNTDSFSNTETSKNSLTNTLPQIDNFKKNINKVGADSSTLSVPITQPDNPLYKADGISLLAGWDYTFGWKINGAPEGNAFTFPFLSINYVHNFSRSMEASIGIGFTHYGILNGTYTSSIIQYDFGQTANITTVTPTTVYYMDFPLAFNYNVSRKWNVSGGLDFLWLLTDLCTITTYQQTLFGTTAQNSYTQDGYTQGFNNYNILFTGGITYIFGEKEKLGLKLEGYWGINSVKNGTFPGTDHSGYWNGVRLLFLWNIFKKES